VGDVIYDVVRVFVLSARIMWYGVNYIAVVVMKLWDNGGLN